VDILIIQCGSRKLTDPSTAEDMYIGGLFITNKKYGEAAYPSNWYILSAQYGLMYPQQPIAPYDKVLKNSNDTELLDKVKGQLGILAPERIDFLGSNVYAEFLAKTGYPITKLLTSIKTPGIRQKYLNHAIDKGIRVDQITEVLHKPSLSDERVLELSLRISHLPKTRVLSELRKLGGISTVRFFRLTGALWD